VIAVHRDQCVLRVNGVERAAVVTGKFRAEAPDFGGFPVVGDWVEAELVAGDPVLIHSLYPRRSLLARKAAGSAVEQQALAANVDVAFIVSAFSEDFNPRRLERYLAVSDQEGITPVLVLNKCDLAAPDDPRLSEAAAIAGSRQLICCSTKTNEGIATIADLIKDGRIGIFLGSSGVGKSSIVNALVMVAQQLTQPVRSADGRGRHTTTARQLFSLPNGGAVIDTPGLREIQLWGDDGALQNVYDDVVSLARSCQFGDCRHDSEPGCAVKAALAQGTLLEERWAAYQKLQREMKHLQRKINPAAASANNKKWKKMTKQMRAHIEDKRGDSEF
jgi:ribosome biogenesis GTPase